MNTLSRDVFPPGGWRFYQPETKWNAPDPLINSFSRMVRVIRQHREANMVLVKLSLEIEDIEDDLESFTRARLKMRPIAPYADLPEKPAKKKSGCRTCSGR